MAFCLMWWPASAVVRPSQSERFVYLENGLTITKFHIDIRRRLVYNHAGYDVTSRFWSAAKCNYILHKSTYNGCGQQRAVYSAMFNVKSPNLRRTSMALDSYDLTSYFWLAFIEVRKNDRKWGLWRLWVEFLWHSVFPDPNNWLASCSQV